MDIKCVQFVPVISMGLICLHCFHEQVITLSLFLTICMPNAVINPRTLQKKEILQEFPTGTRYVLASVCILCARA